MMLTSHIADILHYYETPVISYFDKFDLPILIYYYPKPVPCIFITIALNWDLLTARLNRLGVARKKIKAYKNLSERTLSIAQISYLVVDHFFALIHITYYLIVSGVFGFSSSSMKIIIFSPTRFINFLHKSDSHHQRKLNSLYWACTFAYCHHVIYQALGNTSIIRSRYRRKSLWILSE